MDRYVLLSYLKVKRIQFCLMLHLPPPSSHPLSLSIPFVYHMSLFPPLPFVLAPVFVSPIPPISLCLHPSLICISPLSTIRFSHVLHPSISSLSLALSLSLSLSLSFALSLSLCLSVSFSLSIFLSLYLSLAISLSLYLSLHLSTAPLSFLSSLFPLSPLSLPLSFSLHLSRSISLAPVLFAMIIFHHNPLNDSE